MHIPRFFALSSAVLGFVGTAKGYYIDKDSCKGSDYDTVKNGIESAFSLIDLSLTEVQAKPMGDYTKELLQWLFKADDVIGKKFIEDAYNIKTNNKGERTGVKALEKEVTSLNDVKNDDVVFFCDTKRLKRSLKSPVHLRDTVADQAVSKSRGCGLGTLAWTWNFEKKWDAIQICPEFLKKTVTQQTKTNADLDKSKREKLKKWALGFVTGRAPVNELYLFDMTILHEMMHTKAGGNKDDAGGMFGAYGWENAKKLAEKDLGKINADTYALFAIALQSGKEGFPIKEDGTYK